MAEEVLMTKEEAEAKVEELNHFHVQAEWCPLSNTQCRSDCVCFSRSRTQLVAWKENKPIEGPNRYMVIKGSCCNAMFFPE